MISHNLDRLSTEVQKNFDLTSIDKKTIIECPHCKAQYLPGEIYMPGAILGHPDELVKDALGKIIYVEYSKDEYEPNLIEHFTCEYCNRPFIVEATSPTYKTREEEPERDFSVRYVPLME